ncbi:MAG: PilZ domain-containing protein [Terriglobales bacterium]
MAAPKSERRSQNRIPLRLPVSIRSPQTESLTGYTRDLSMTGIFLYTDAKILEGSDLEMVLMLPPQFTNGEKQWVCCHASVVRVEGGQGDQQIGVAANIRNIAALPEIPI